MGVGRIIKKQQLESCCFLLAAVRVCLREAVFTNGYFHGLGYRLFTLVQ